MLRGDVEPAASVERYTRTVGFVSYAPTTATNYGGVTQYWIDVLKRFAFNEIEKCARSTVDIALGLVLP